jgi:UDP-N-acetylmuramoyl-L-alanyl-D-glutamate--2,6-diaminopimelate ligase
MKSEWRLSELLKGVGLSRPAQGLDSVIKQVTDDSRWVQPGALFMAVPGTQVDGHQFVQEAIERGAAALLLEQDLAVPAHLQKILVPAVRPLAGPLAHLFLDQPTHKLQMIGVTGTNGKTTVTWLVEYLLSAVGVDCGLIGSICNKWGQVNRPSRNTTPGASQLQRLFGEMVDQRLQACVMEVSSHALDQHRVEGVQWRCGVFTNLTPEHLDYHATMTDYLWAKLKLFRQLPPGAAAVISRDDPAWEKVVEAARENDPRRPVWTTSLSKPAQITVQELSLSLEGSRGKICWPGREASFFLPMIGAHNVANLMAAVGVLSALELPVSDALRSLPDFKGVPGRLEWIPGSSAFPVLVDYAHTGEALEEVLGQIRALTQRKIWLVFGCGGDRDQSKRPRMGEVAGRLADHVIVTSDNPRSEDPQEIAEAVVKGIDSPSAHFEVILDRAEAIAAALANAGSDDLVLVAGKGHETEQEIAGERSPFDDREVVRSYLSGVGALK